MRKLIWRAYTIADERELAQAMARYERATGKKAVCAQVSDKAPKDLVAWVERSGLEVVHGKGMLARDVWLTHQTEKSLQKSLFEGGL